jgi:triacylglycerol esterase/lipase EstA (alpha/beta hydrolase family)
MKTVPSHQPGAHALEPLGSGHHGMGGLLSTLYIKVLTHVTRLGLSHEVQVTLSGMFSSATLSKLMQIRVQLVNLYSLCFKYKMVWRVQ